MIYKINPSVVIDGNVCLSQSRSHKSFISFYANEWENVFIKLWGPEWLMVQYPLPSRKKCYFFLGNRQAKTLFERNVIVLNQITFLFYKPMNLENELQSKLFDCFSVTKTNILLFNTNQCPFFASGTYFHTLVRHHGSGASSGFLQKLLFSKGPRFSIWSSSNQNPSCGDFQGRQVSPDTVLFAVPLKKTLGRYWMFWKLKQYTFDK